MEKVQFRAYAIDFSAADYDTKGLPPGVKFSHTFVTSPNYDWNCFGHGKDSISQATRLQSGTGSTYEEWALEVYGQYWGTNYQDQQHAAAGVTVRVNGVCHNASNRILALAGADVSDADGDAVVLLMYGKYGFGIEEYIQLVKNAGEKANVPDEEVNAVVAKIMGEAPEEFEDLEKELLRQHFLDHLGNQGIGSDQLAQMQQAYAKFEEQRATIYQDTKSNNPDITTFQGQFTSAIKPELFNCLTEMMEILGQEKYLDLFKLHPEMAAQFLLG